MCQPKPGPRCAGHVRGDIAAAKRTLRTAETTQADADAAFEAAKTGLREARRKPRTGYVGHEADSDEARAYQAAMAAKVAADTALQQARDRHRTFLRQYETTPEGQKMVARAIIRLRQDGDEEGAQAQERRLDEAISTRLQQEAELAEARAQALRLTNLTPAEGAALDQADAALAESAYAVTVAEDTVADLHRQHADLQPAYEEAANTHATALAVVKAQRQQIIDTQAEAYTEAKRLYIEAGVTERFAGFYAKDSLEAAQNVRGDAYSGQGFARRPLTLKVKRNGPDVEKTRAAAAAAKTDEGFRAANTRLAQVIESHALVAAAEAEGPRRDLDTLQAQRYRINSDLAWAERTLTDARRAHEQRTDQTARLRAQIAAGAGTATEPVDLRRARDEIVRQPDGSTNAYVYEAPRPGFPHGRYRRVAGVTTVHGMGSANGLVLDNGQTVNASEHYGRGPHGARHTVHNPGGVIITPAQPGSHPLRIEAVPEAGFATFVDSTD